MNSIQEVQIRYVRNRTCETSEITSVDDAEILFRSFLDPERIDFKEFFWVMLLSNARHVLGMSEIAVGDTAEIAVNKKEIFQLALKANASAVILCHNHPSGNLTPSNADISLTQDIAAFGAMIGVTVLDHIIISSEGYYSFMDEKKL